MKREYPHTILHRSNTTHHLRHVPLIESHWGNTLNYTEVDDDHIELLTVDGLGFHHFLAMSTAHNYFSQTPPTEPEKIFWQER